MAEDTQRASVHQRICQSIDQLSDTLIEVSRDIHAHPELAFVEHRAQNTLCQALEAQGMPTERGVFTLETAFESRFGEASSGPTVAVLAEYDALPGIGHACGHNLIATSALGAALGLAAVRESLPGQVRLLGTPAEEKGGGKELMARAGAFTGVDAAMMIHPAGVNLTTMPCICVAEVEVVYHGRSAHASAMPHKGINALDGLLIAYQAISNLRQHIRDTERIHGVITDGGRAPNIVPDRSAAEFYVRARDEQALAKLKPRVQACFEAGATASGCKVEVNWAGVDYLDLNSNGPLAARFQHHGEALGRHFESVEKFGGSGSTDMGNVSHRVPSIHPMLACAPPNVVIHHPEFATWAGSEMGDQAALDGAKALALTAADFLLDRTLQSASQRAFEISKGLA